MPSRKSTRTRASAYDAAIANALQLYEKDGVRAASARPIVTKFMSHNYDLIESRDGSIVWRRELGRTRHQKTPTMAIEIMGRDGDLVTNINKGGVVQIVAGDELGFHFIISDVGLFIDTTDFFNLVDIGE